METADEASFAASFAVLSLQARQHMNRESSKASVGAWQDRESNATPKPSRALVMLVAGAGLEMHGDLRMLRGPLG